MPADSGSQAIEILRQLQTTGQPARLVITDINMPNMDGLTLLHEISSIDPLMKTVILSAYGDMSNIRVAMNRGAFDFLIKTPESLAHIPHIVTRSLREWNHIVERRRADVPAGLVLVEHRHPGLVAHPGVAPAHQRDQDGDLHKWPYNRGEGHA